MDHDQVLVYEVNEPFIKVLRFIILMDNFIKGIVKINDFIYINREDINDFLDTKGVTIYNDDVEDELIGVI